MEAQDNQSASLPALLQAKLDDFLVAQGVAQSVLNSELLISDFVKQMSDGKKGASSLAMLDSHINVPTLVPENKKVIAIDAGGTHLRCAHLSFTKGSGQIAYQLENLHKFPMPGTKKLLSKEEFFDTLYQYIEPLLDEVDTIGFCFSYPCEIAKNGDGKLLSWTKEIQAPDVENTWIGEELNTCIVAHGKARKRIVLLNDTVATLLASKSHACSIEKKTSVNSHAYIGFILGTGTNCAYSEGAENHIVNIESGAYNGAKMQVLDYALDQASSNPNAYGFEKKIAGRYLGELCLRLLTIASQQDFLSETCRQSIITYSNQHGFGLDSQYLNQLLDVQHDSSVFETHHNDRLCIKVVVEALIDRAALLSAIQLYSISLTMKNEAGGRPFDLLINIEGSTYYLLQGYQQKINSHFQTLMAGSGINYRFLKTENASLLGAGIAALSQFR